MTMEQRLIQALGQAQLIIIQLQTQLEEAKKKAGKAPEGGEKKTGS